MAARSPFPPVFWIANLIEVLERFAYYGIYFSFGIYMTSLGFSRDQLGFVQTLFLLLSYCLPLFSGTLADRFGFKTMLIVAYLAYLPAILLLILTKSFSGIALTMLSIGFAAGIFKPLIFGTVRAVTDKTNSTLGVGIFYAMVNVGGSLGPVIMGRLRAISWDYAFYAAAIAIGLMLVITVLFYKEPPREIEKRSFGEKLREIGEALSDRRFALFLLLLGLGFWIPFWGFFNLCALYVDKNLDTVRLYEAVRGVLGEGVAGFLSHEEGRQAADPRRDDLAHRLHHHDPAGLRVAHGRALQADADLLHRPGGDVGWASSCSAWRRWPTRRWSSSASCSSRPAR